MLQIDDIIRTVADHYGLDRECVVARSRSKMPTHARQVAMYLSKTTSQHSLAEIGRCFDRNHTTVLHAVRSIGAKLKNDEELKADIDLLSARCSSRVQLRRVA
jgi:chromosomal replication initiator protein